MDRYALGVVNFAITRDSFISDQSDLNIEFSNKSNDGGENTNLLPPANTLIRKDTTQCVWPSITCFDGNVVGVSLGK